MNCYHPFIHSLLFCWLAMRPNGSTHTVQYWPDFKEFIITTVCSIVIAVKVLEQFFESFHWHCVLKSFVSEKFI
jgi:hypothetical protein